jgi:hypothetical protein
MTEKLNKKHYVDNEAFYKALVDRRKQLKKLKKNQERPPVSEYIGECIIAICENYSLVWKFINYSYRDDLVGDAIENCLRGIDTFDPDKSNKPFSYFTMTAHRAFLRRIKAEHDEAYIKAKLIEKLPEEDLIELDNDTGETTNFMDKIRKDYYFDTEEYERKLDEKKIKAKQARESKLSQFMETD